MWVKPFNTRLNPRYVNDRLAAPVVHPSSVTREVRKAKPKYIGCPVALFEGKHRHSGSSKSLLFGGLAGVIA